MHTCLHCLACLFTHPFPPSLPFSLNFPNMRSRALMLLLRRARSRSLIPSFVHSFIYVLMRPISLSRVPLFTHPFLICSVHPYLRSHIRSVTLSCPQSPTHPCSPSFAHTFPQTFNCSFIHSPIGPLLGSLFPSSTHAFIHPPFLSLSAVRRIFAQGSPEISLAKFFGRQCERSLRACSVAAKKTAAPKPWDPTA